MIEIELRFHVKTPPPGLTGLAPQKEKSQIDIYYDTADYTLFRRGIFLRVRNNHRLDFKGNLQDRAEIQHDYCDEFGFDLSKIPAESPKINQLLKLSGIDADKAYSDLNDFLRYNNLSVFATIDKKRLEYKIADMLITLDDVKDIGLFIEAELNVPDDTAERDIKQHIEDMRIKLTEHGVLGPDARASNIGLVEEYLKLHNRTAYDLGLYKE